MFGKRIGSPGASTSTGPSTTTPVDDGAGTEVPALENRPTNRASSPSAPLEPLPRRQACRATGISANARRGAPLQLGPSLTNDITRIDNAKKTVDRARKYGKTWQLLASGQRGACDIEQGLTMAKQGLESAQGGLAALEEAKRMGQEPPGGYEDAKAELIGYLLQAAEFGIVTLHKQLEEWNRTGMVFETPDLPIALGAGSPPRSVEAVIIGQALAEMADKRSKLQTYEKIVLDFPAWLKAGGNHGFLQAHATKMKLSRQVAQSTMRGMNARTVELQIERLKASGLCLGSVMDRMGEDSLEKIDDTPELRDAWDVIDQPDDRSAAQLADAKAVAIRYLGGIDALSEQLCFEAADRIDTDDQSDLWQHALDMAGAFKTYASYLRGLCDELRVGSGTVVAGATRRTVQAAPSMRSPNASSRKPEQDMGSSQTILPPQGEASASQTAVPDYIGAVPESSSRAPAVAKRPTTKYRELAERAGGDVVSIGRELGKDTRAVEQMSGSMFDPMDAAQFLRKSAQSWLGDIGNLRKAIGRARRASPKDEQRIEQLMDRLEALTLMDRNIATAEADALKRLIYPKAKHLRQLLQLKAIENVDPLIRLAADGDVGNKGTLFEMKIRLQRLSDGERARPLFLHLHTSKLVTCEEARTLPFSMLTSAHVKTDAQKNQGRKWEELMGALGAVHRGKIDDPALLDQLRRFRPTT